MWARLRRQIEVPELGMVWTIGDPVVSGHPGKVTTSSSVKMRGGCRFVVVMVMSLRRLLHPCSVWGALS
jgi:hypothetical protein